MKAGVLADADLRFGIVHGLQVREPAIDFLPAQGIIPESMEDPDVLAFACGEAEELRNRIVQLPF